MSKDGGAKFGSMGRLIGSCCVIGLAVAGGFEITDTSSFFLSLYCIGISPFVGLIELPWLCQCAKWCKIVGKYLRVVAGYWVSRALIHIGLAAGGFAIYQLTDTTKWFLLLPLVAQVVTATLYLVAMARREANPDPLQWGKNAAEGGADGATAPSTGAAPAKPSFFGALLSGNKKEAAAAAASNPAVIGAAAAAAPSIAQAMFAAKDGDDEESAPAPAPAGGVASAASAAASMFTGGSLFGGSKGKYGYDADTLEANPFMSS